MDAHFYTKLPDGTVQSIDHSNICDLPSAGDKVKLDETWWEIVGIEELRESDGGNMKVRIQVH